MAFVNSLFPNPKLIHDLEVFIGAETDIVSNSNREYRLQKQQHYRTRWRWPSRAMLSTEATTIANFLANTARFSLNSFKFKDPYLHTWNLHPLTYSGSANRYILTAPNGAHPIYHYDADVVVRLNGTPTAATKVIIDDVPMVQLPSTGTVTISGTFFYAARLDQPDFARIMTALNSNNGALADTIGDVSLVEVFEY